MNSKKELIELRQSNCGYNPEKAEDFFIVQPLDLNNEIIICYDKENEHSSVWYKTNVCNEIDFIKKHPQTYGVIYNGGYYVESSD